MTEQVALPSLKGHVQRLLDRAGVYHRMKASWIYDLYWRLADRRVIYDGWKQVYFYRNVLRGFREGDLIFDVGANQGHKTGIFPRLGARVVAVERDAACQDILKQKFLKYWLKRKPLAIVGKTMSDRSSIKTMWIGTPRSAKNTLSHKWADMLRGDDKRFGQRLSFAARKEIETSTVEQLVTVHGLPFFVKIDVEGHELSLLREMQRPVPYLSSEVNLPEFGAEGLGCVRVLRDFAREARFNYTGLPAWAGTEAMASSR